MARITIDSDVVKFFVNPPATPTKGDIYINAVNRAYADMSRHTLSYTNSIFKGATVKADENRWELKKKIAKDLQIFEDKIFKTPKKRFNDLHNKMCKQVIKDFITNLVVDSVSLGVPIIPDAKNPEDNSSFTYGQAQKVVNMTLKYVYLLYSYFNSVNSQVFANELKEFNKVKAWLHCPIDNYVIDALTKKKINKKANIYKNPNISAPQKAWSKMHKNEYQNFQAELFKCLKPNPFEWELQNYPFNL